MSMTAWFKKFLGQWIEMPAASPTDANPPSTLPHGDEAAFQQSCARRDTYWAAVGTVERDVLTHLNSPSLMGGPAWPTTRQAYRGIRRPATILMATDGMSDPFEPLVAEGNGFGMELFIETADIAPELAGTVGDITALSRSWAFELLSNAAGASPEPEASRVNWNAMAFSPWSFQVSGSRIRSVPSYRRVS